MSVQEELDRWLPSRGPCLVCAIREHAEAGELPGEIARELELPVRSVHAVLGSP